MNKHKHKSHPWHGISIGENAPAIVTAFIEIVPSDTVKYEIDKESGYLKVDRPQKFSNVIPSLYGFIPQTYCGANVAKYASERSKRIIESGDKDPLDICVLTERIISHGDIILKAKPIGGFRLIDKGEADDKIIAVLYGDDVYGNFETLSDCPESIINRLKHYFLTYKNIPGETTPTCVIDAVYAKEEALQVIEKSREDYMLM
ncbi:MAG: inorganic pyrophosphatase [Bacteroidetes bacterium]|nr:inorganic pyrophosphatase [Bacteroidota bacterium]